MASIIFTLPDDALPLVTEAFCATFGYAPFVSPGTAGADPVPNPVTPGEFTRQQVVTMVRGVVGDYHGRKAGRDAAAKAQESLDAIPVTVDVKEG